METRLFSLPTSFLILHKVRGESAFDIAEQIPCGICGGIGGDYQGLLCDECNALGYWWIIPTSGHRAYPYQWTNLAELMEHGGSTMGGMPKDWSGPDHYPCNPSPKPPAFDLLGRLGLRQKVERRI